MEERLHLGDARNDTLIPAAPSKKDMDGSYPAFIAGIKNEIARQRTRVALSANADIHEAFPNMTGFSARNIKYMRKFAECWPDFELVPRAVALIPWRSIRTLMDKLDTTASRDWYAEKTLENGWSSAILQAQIESHLMERTGGSANNFASSRRNRARSATSSAS